MIIFNVLDKCRRFHSLLVLELRSTHTLHAVSLKQQADFSAFRLELLIKVLFAGFRELALNMIHGEEQAGPNENFGA